MSLEKMSDILVKNGILNFAFAYEDENGEVLVEISNHFAKTSQFIKNPAKLSQIFPNKLENMHKTPIRAVANYIMPHVKIQNGEAISIHKNIFETIAEKLNATLEVKILNTRSSMETLAEGKVLYERREVDMTLGAMMEDASRILVSYVEFGYCALIPFKSAQKQPSLFFLETFELSTVFMLLMTLACIMILWRVCKALGEAHGSSLSIAFGLMASFVGQSFKIRTTNFLMYSLIVLNIYATIVLNNLYQGM